ncbi:tetratricopeptide repeat protein [Streptomyces sp. NPDC056491]|uniref:tetratricopeptide repeat protein n=1 Tax=Streptomyces sp. NPDC056491 TaxID=3345837 RepID=UPI003689A161
MLTQLLTGMGGVGKTQLAADYARTAWNDSSTAGGLDVLVWVTAHSRQDIVTGYAQAGIELCRAEPNDAERAARSFLAWLAPKAAVDSCRWLIVLDDVADPSDLRGLWPPDSPYGRTLVTTRRRDAALAADGRQTVEVGLFTAAEALTYLTTSLAGRRSLGSVEELTALAGDLGYLPLGLAQAAAYLMDTGETAGDYRQLLSDRTITLAEATPDALPDDQALPLAAAWSLSIDRADMLRPSGLARPLLQLAAFLDSSGIPQAVLTSAPALAYLAEHRRATGPELAVEPVPVLPRDAVRALTALHRLSLIDHTPETPHQAVRVHQLIQRASREGLASDQYDLTARTAADALMATWPGIERDTDLAHAMRANATALIKNANDALYQPQSHAVLLRVGASLGRSGQVTAALEYHLSLIQTVCHHRGPDHPDTFMARSRFARGQADAGDLAAASSGYAELLEDMVRVLGPDHPDIQITRGDLASARGEAGDAAGAAIAYAELLADRVRLLGPDHIDTLNARGHLATWQGEAGDVAGAVSGIAELLEDMVRVLGPDHPVTFAARGNLASWRGTAGDLGGAVSGYVALLEDMVRVLGPDHPQTFAARGNLASWRGHAGDSSGAAEGYAQLLEHVLRVLDPDHPHIIATRGNLAHWLGEAGDAAGAAEGYAQLLEQALRVLGPDHPHTLATRSNLANWRGAAQDLAGAAAAFAELLVDRTRVLGPDHPDILTTQGHLARLRGEMGDAVGAVTAFAQLLKDRTRVTGADHPETLATRGILAYWRREAGDAAETLTEYTELLSDTIRILGPDHPYTLVTRGNLASCVGDAGDVAGAVIRYTELLADLTRVMGPNHPHTCTTRDNLAYLQQLRQAEKPSDTD